MTTETTIFDRLQLLADTTRCRLLLVLADQELTVSELCTVLQLPQSTVSRHLKVLGNEGWLASRRDGTSRFYRATLDELEPAARRLWDLAREEVATLAVVEQDARRLAGVLAERRSKSQEFFSSAAGRWDRLRQELFGRRGELLPLLALLPEEWVVGDLGCGTGRVAETLAPFISRVIAVDDSEAMLATAQERLAPYPNVEIRRGRLEELPVDDDSLDVAVLALVLHHVPEPGRALAEAARAIRPDGRLLLVDMEPHEREDYRSEMGHVWLGFPAERIDGWLTEAGFEEIRSRPLPGDPEAKGPTLFAATARRAAAGALSEPAETMTATGL